MGVAVALAELRPRGGLGGGVHVSTPLWLLELSSRANEADVSARSGDMMVGLLTPLRWAWRGAGGDSELVLSLLVEATRDMPLLLLLPMLPTLRYLCRAITEENAECGRYCMHETAVLRTHFPSSAIPADLNVAEKTAIKGADVHDALQRKVQSVCDEPKSQRQEK